MTNLGPEDTERFRSLGAAAKRTAEAFRGLTETLTDNRDMLRELQEAEMERRASPRWRYVILVVAMILAAIVAVVLP